MNCICGFAPRMLTSSGLRKAWAMKLSERGPMTTQPRSTVTQVSGLSAAKASIMSSVAALSSAYWKPRTGRTGDSSV